MLSMADFPHVSDERLRTVLAHWLEIRRGRLLPARQDIDPGRIRAALPYVWLCDYDSATGNFRYRLAGEEVNALYGTNLAGRDLGDSLPADIAPGALARYRRMAQEPVVSHMKGKIHFTDGRELDGERLVFPLGSDGARMDTLWGTVVCNWRGGGDGVLRSEKLLRTITPITKPE